jgi:hypothetical protein
MGTMKPLKRLDGLGDLVEVVTEATGIKAAAEAISKATRRDCGCGRRKEALNRLVPFKKENADGVQRDQD